MIKLIIFSLIGWLLFKILKAMNIISRKNSVQVTENNGKNELKYNKGDIEDADFKDLDE